VSNSTTQPPAYHIDPKNDFGVAYAYGSLRGLAIVLDWSSDRPEDELRKAVKTFLERAAGVDEALQTWRNERIKN
jgi:hypothetical protein